MQPNCTAPWRRGGYVVDRRLDRLDQARDRSSFYDRLIAVVEAMDEPQA